MADTPQQSEPCVHCCCLAMRVRVWWRWLAALWGLALLVTPAAAKYQYPCSTAVEVWNGSAGGSATLVGVANGRGLLLTVWHLFEDGVHAPTCRFPDSRRRWACRILAVDQPHDLAALESEAIEGDVTALRVRSVRRADDTLTAVGYPFYATPDKGPHITSGQLLRLDGDDLKAAFRPVVHSGFSGGGVFAADGSLVGVISGYNDARESIACSGPALETFVAQWLKQPEVKP